MNDTSEQRLAGCTEQPAAPRKPLHWDIAWPLMFLVGVVLWAVYLFGVDRHFLESIKAGPAVMLVHSFVGLSILPIGAILAIPIWFIAWLLKRQERVSFKGCLLAGMALFNLLGFAGRQYADSQLEAQRRADLAGLEFLDGRLSYAGPVNALVDAYRKKVPGDPRSDDELTLALGQKYDADGSFADVPSFVTDYQRLKQTNSWTLNLIQGRVRNKSPRALRAVTLECTFYDAGKTVIDTRLVTLTNLSCPPRGETQFRGQLDLLSVPRQFKWTHRFTSGAFYYQADREFPSEKTLVITNFVTNMVPAQLNPAQILAIGLAERYLNAEVLRSGDDGLYKLGSVRVLTAVTVPDDLQKYVSEEKLRNKFELTLRKQNVKVDDKSLHFLILDVTCEPLPLADIGACRYEVRIKLLEKVLLDHDGDFKFSSASIWEDGTVGAVSNEEISGRLLRAVEDKAENFANKYLAAQERFK